MYSKNLISLCTLLLLISTSTIHSQCSNTGNVPYLENFQAITANNQLPTCWAASNLSVTCLTNASPAFNAAFYYSPAATNYFYSNGVLLSPGITYSAALWAKTSISANSNWLGLAIMIGTSQSTSGLTTIVSTTGPSLTTSYSLLSNTFVVTAPGVYYIAIQGVGGGTASQAQYLYFDDLSITMPCSSNTPSVSVSVSAYSICQGNPVTLNASGANTYTWNTGSNTAVLTVTPNANTTYVVSGTNTITNCFNTASTTIQVKPSPNVSVFSNNSFVCRGNSVTLGALGGNLNYLWNFGSTSPTVVVTPSVATSYSVTATNSFGCSSSASQLISVYPLPSVTASATRYTLCENENVILTAGGASTYTWSWPGNGVSTSYSVSINSASSGNYIVNGSDNNGCLNTATVSLTVNTCTDIHTINASNQSLHIFPNPTQGEFTIDTFGKTLDLLQLFDINGKLIYESNVSAASYNFRSLSPGIYQLKASSGSAVYNCKFVKE